MVPVYPHDPSGPVPHISCANWNRLSILQCYVLYIILKNSGTKPSGCVHGLANSVWKRSTDSWTCVHQPSVHCLGSTVGFQPGVWDGGAYHHTPGCGLQKTHCFFCKAWKDSRITQLRLCGKYLCETFSFLRLFLTTAMSQFPKVRL